VAAPDQAPGGMEPGQAAGLARLLAALPWAQLARLHALADAGDLRRACAGPRWLPSAPGEPALRAACERLFARLLVRVSPFRRLFAWQTCIHALPWANLVRLADVGDFQ